MIQCYPNGPALTKENQAFLDTNPYLSMFFSFDAPLLISVNEKNYAIRSMDTDGTLLALKVEPYSLLLFGDAARAEELTAYLMNNGYVVEDLLGDETTCSAVASVMENRYGISYVENLPMDFMEAKVKTEPSCPDVTHADSDDLSELCECMRNFMCDCGLNDPVEPEKVLAMLDSYRILRVDGRIASTVRITRSTENSRKLAFVYTRPEYRGMGLARKVVATAMNEIIDAGLIATLNVDRNNPVSNHLYSSLGFVRLFSQGAFSRKS